MLYLKKRTEFPPLFNAVGCLCLCQGKMLLLKRANDKSYPHHWGIPGGKVQENESEIRSVVRELFEETSLLASAANLSFIKTYHVVTDEMSFLYTVYRWNLETTPHINIRTQEHSCFAWFNPNDALRLKLVPHLDDILKDILPYLNDFPMQLSLFLGNSQVISPPTISLEEVVQINVPQCLHNSKNKNKKTWHVSFGPPCAGKTTAFRAMSRENQALTFVGDKTILKRTSRLNFYLRKAFEEENRSYFFHFQLEVLPLRFWQAIKAPDHSLVDETIFSTLAYSRALYMLDWLNEHEYQTFYCNYLTYLTYLNTLSTPVNIYYFNCNVEKLMKRIRLRSRKIETCYSIEYISALYQAFSDVGKELSEDYNVVKIDTNQLRAEEIVKLYGPHITY